MVNIKVALFNLEYFIFTVISIKDKPSNFLRCNFHTFSLENILKLYKLFI